MHKVDVLPLVSPVGVVVADQIINRTHTRTRPSCNFGPLTATLMLVPADTDIFSLVRLLARPVLSHEPHISKQRNDVTRARTHTVLDHGK